MALELGFDVAFDEALAFARDRGVVLPEDFYGRLQGAARARAFTISDIESVDQIEQVLDDMNDALANGQTFRAWQESVGTLLEALSVARQELVFRMAAQTAYGIGHTIRQRENKATRPFLMWDAINDNRTRPTHAEMDGFIAPVDDPTWQHWHVPAGFNCRCARISLTEAQAQARGYPMPPRAVSPDPGFDGPDPADDWTTQLDDDLARRSTFLPTPVRDALERVKRDR